MTLKSIKKLETSALTGGPTRLSLQKARSYPRLTQRKPLMRIVGWQSRGSLEFSTTRGGNTTRDDAQQKTSYRLRCLGHLLRSNLGRFKGCSRTEIPSRRVGH